MPPLPDLAVHDTFPKLLRLHARERGAEVAWREKQLGVWRSMSWSEVQGRVRDLALGLVDLGIGRGEVVALIGDSRPDWVAGEIAAHAVGAMSLGLYRDALDREIGYLIDYAGAAIVLAEDEEQVDKLLSLGDAIPSVRHIVYSDPRGMRKYDDPRLLAADALARRGRALEEAEPGRYDALVDAGDGEDVAILCTTSGTTAQPKLTMLTAGRFLRHCADYLGVDPLDPEDDYVSLLPLPWVGEQMYAVGLTLLSRMKLNFPEEPETGMADMREIAPTLILFAPRRWEALAAEIEARRLDASPFKRRMFDFAMRRGLAAYDKGRRDRLAEFLLFRALRDRYGFTRLRSATTGGAAIGPDTFRFFRAIGVPLKQLYGQTELTGIYTIHLPQDTDPDTVGVPISPRVEIRIADPDANGVGEIVTRHPHMFVGYYRNEEASREALTADGWMHTGDAGYFKPNGHLVVIDRIRDLATTRQGIRFSPQYIENKLKFSPYVGEAVVLGHGRDFVSAIICIRFGILSKIAEKRRIAFTTYTDLSSRPEIQELIRGEVERVNATLPESQRIARFVLLYKELDADDAELTRTGKVRRGVIAERYADIIDAIYAGRDQVRIDTVVTFQDGSTARIRTDMRIIDMGERPPARAAAAE